MFEQIRQSRKCDIVPARAFPDGRTCSKGRLSAQWDDRFSFGVAQTHAPRSEAQMKDGDLRKARRYGLHLPVTVQSQLKSLTSTQSGKIIDISIQGIYFIVEENPGLGVRLNLTLTIPGEITGAPDVFIQFTGKVLRVESRTEDAIEKFGVAVSIEKYEMTGNNRKI